MYEKQNEKTAYAAGIRGWPSPEVTSPHHYSNGEMQAWEHGQEIRESKDADTEPDTPVFLS